MNKSRDTLKCSYLPQTYLTSLISCRNRQKLHDNLCAMMSLYHTTQCRIMYKLSDGDRGYVTRKKPCRSNYIPIYISILYSWYQWDLFASVIDLVKKIMVQHKLGIHILILSNMLICPSSLQYSSFYINIAENLILRLNFETPDSETFHDTLDIQS